MVNCVYYEDTDGGVVYHASYVAFMVMTYRDAMSSFQPTGADG